MKIKAPIYFASVLAGALALFLGPGLVGKELGLAAGFTLLMFGLYGLSRRTTAEEPDSHNKEDEP